MPKPEFELPTPRRVREDLLRLLAEPDAAKLAGALRLLAKYRSHLIQWELARSHDAEVRAGPFRGMKFIDHSAEGCHVPKILGCYEHELQPYFEAAIASSYDDIVNVGCAEGYYAVGMALRMPQARIHAYDIDDKARALCERIARQNGVTERVRIGEAFTAAGFREFAQRRVLFLVDIEGSELELFAGASRDDVAPFDFIVECHDAVAGKVSAPLLARLAPTHHVRLVKHGLPSPEFPPLLESAGHLDQLLAVWEWRGHPTPWLVAASRSTPSTPFSAAVAGASS